MKKIKAVNLSTVLGGRTVGSSLINDIDRISNRSEPILSKITETFSDYTIHDLRHSKKIIEILSWIMPPELIKNMNEYELYFLIASCYLHDIGMADIQDLDSEEISQMRTIEEKRNFIRNNHHLRSEKFIVKNFERLGIEDEHQARIIGRICRGHREKPIGDLYSNREMYTSENISINIPLLASLLQIADDLDLTFERTPKIIFDMIKPKSDISREEWERHLSTCGVGQDPENSLRIIISAKCWNLKVHRALKGLEIKLQEQLDSLSDRLFQYHDFSSVLPQRVIVIIENIGYEVVDLKFKLQEKEITSILMGEQLYDRKEAALRELLQNSYDACRHRMQIDPTLKPKITFQLSADRQMLTISDNGVGMNKERIEKYLVRIGSCFYKSREFLEKGLDFTPISSFGIGFLSCFMISEHIQVETKAMDDEPFIVEIYGIEDYFLMKKGNKQDTGTKITLFLNEEFGKTLDLEKEMRFYARHLEFPVFIILQNGEEKQIIDEHKTPFVEQFLRKQYAKNLDNYGFKSYSLSTEKYRVVFHFLSSKDQKLGLIPIITPWYNREFKQSKLEVSMEGIYVGDIKDILPEYFNQWLFIEINLKSFTIDLNVSRTAIVKNLKFQSLRTELEDLLLKCLKDWVLKYEQQHGHSHSIRNGVVDAYVNQEIYEASRSRREIPKELKASALLLTFIRDIYCFKLLEKNRVLSGSYNQLLAGQRTVTILTNSLYEEEEYIRTLMVNCSSFIPNNLYLMSNWHDLTDFCDKEKKVFTNVMSFESMFKFENLNSCSLKKAFPKTWKVVKFSNLKSFNIIEPIGGHSNGIGTYVNADNKFISLLLRRPDVVLNRSERLAILEAFFIKLKRNLKNNFQSILSDQERILKWYVAAGVIMKTDDYLLEPEQLPYYYLKFQKKV